MTRKSIIRALSGKLLWIKANPRAPGSFYIYLDARKTKMVASIRIDTTFDCDGNWFKEATGE